MTDRAYNGAWPAARLATLERDGWQCQIRGEKCTRTATEVDHIIPLNDGGARLDPRNLRSVCRSCHHARKHRAVTLVVVHPDGPPSREW